MAYSNPRPPAPKSGQSGRRAWLGVVPGAIYRQQRLAHIARWSSQELSPPPTWPDGPQEAVSLGHLDVGGGGAGVLGGVGERLGDGVVGGDLQLLRQPIRYLDVGADGDGGRTALSSAPVASVLRLRNDRMAWIASPGCGQG